MYRTGREQSTKLDRAIRVVIAAGVRLYREGLAHKLAACDRLAIVGSAGNRNELLELVTTAEPHVVVLDMAMRDSLELVRATVAAAPRARIIAFAIDDQDREILACAEAGVAGYVTCEASTEDVVSTIEGATRGELLCTPRTASMLFRRLSTLAAGGHELLGRSLITAREREIVVLIDEGLSNKEIAQRLRIEVATVKNHVHKILEKLKVTSRAEAAARLRDRSTRLSRSDRSPET